MSKCGTFTTPNDMFEHDSSNSDTHDTQNLDHHLPEKQHVHRDIVIMMDSNRKHIRPDWFYGRGKTRIVRCAEAKDIISVSHEFDFHDVKHIFVSTGTNDVGENDSNQDDINRSVDDIVHDILEGAEELQRQYPNTSIYIVQLPPRRDNYQMKTKRVNNKLAELVPEGFHLVKHDLTTRNMHDDKHIKRNHIHILVNCMKEK